MQKGSSDRYKKQLLQAWAMSAVLSSQSSHLLTSASHFDLLQIARIVSKLFSELPLLLEPDEACRTRSIPASRFAAVLNRALNINEGTDSKAAASNLPLEWSAMPSQVRQEQAGSVSKRAWSVATSSELSPPQSPSLKDSLVDLLQVILEAPGSSEALLWMSRERNLRVIEEGSKSWREVLVSISCLCEARSQGRDDQWRELKDRYK